MKTSDLTANRRRSRLTITASLAALVFFITAPETRADNPTPGLTRAVFTNVPGLLIADLTNHFKFPASPDLVETIGTFETPSQFADSYGEKVFGFLLPPITGDYVFYIAADDQAALYLSSNAMPANKVLVATESGWSWPRNWTGSSPGRVGTENISRPIRLEAGQAYYVEALHKEGGGGDNFGVTWQMPGQPEPGNGSEPIPGQYLSTAIPPATFDLSFFTAGTVATNGLVFSRHYSLSGPAQGSILLPGMRVTPENAGRFYFAAHPHEALKVDSFMGSAEAFQPGPELPELNWPTSMTYDSTRNRALLVSFGGEGFLYAYDPSPHTWSLVSSMDNRDLDAIVYHPRLDALFGIGVFNPTFYSFSPEGVYQWEMALSGLPPYGMQGYQAELAPAGDAVVLILGPNLAEGLNMPSQESWMYLIDPASRTCRLVFHSRHAPSNQSPTVCLAQPGESSSLPLGNTLHLVANASDPDGTIHSLEFFANSRSIGFGTRIPGGSSFSLPYTLAALGHYRIQALATDDDGMVECSLPIQLTVVPRTPVVTWPAPGAITYGDPLGGSQLNATASVPGSFQYTPSAGAILGAGTRMLSVKFTPSDPALVPVEATASLRVEKASLTVRADDKTREQGQPNPPLTASCEGFVVGETAASLDTQVTLATTATIDSPPGIYPITATGAFDANYDITHQSGAMVVLPAGNPGTIDPTFDPSRRGELIGFEGDHGWVLRLAVQADGKVIAAGGFIGASGVPRRNLVRLNPDGGADPSFRVSIGGNRQVTCLAIQPDGRILIGGDFTEVNDRPRPYLARLHPDGSLDRSFTPLLSGATHEFAQDIRLQPDGKILLGGSFTTVNGQPRHHVARLNPDGNLDLSFVPAPWPAIDHSRFACLALQPDGKILLGHVTCDPVAALRRLNPDGSLDTGFTLGVPPGTWCAGVRQVEMTTNHKLVIRGEFGPWRYVARLHENGSEDTSFVPPRFTAIVRQVVAQPDGKVLVLSDDVHNSSSVPNGLARLNPDGSIDLGFSAGESAGYPDRLLTVTLRQDGRILVGRSFEYFNNPNPGAIAQVHPDGSADTSFRFRLHPGGAMVSAILPLPDGRAIVAGHFTRLNDVPRVGVAGLNPDGTVDQNFSPPAEPMAWVDALARQPDGRILVSGSFGNPNPPFANSLVRLHPNGSLDTSFSLPNDFSGEAHAIALQPDGKILIGGSVGFVTGPWCLARLHPDGSPDFTFQQGAGIAGADPYVEDVQVQPDGKILVAGSFESYNGVPRSGLFRLHPDGSLDGSFEVDPESLPWVGQLQLLRDGSILALGSSLYRLYPDGSIDTSFTAPQSIYGFALEPNGRLLVFREFPTTGSSLPMRGLVRLGLDGTPDPDFSCLIDPTGWVSAIALQEDGRVLIGGSFENVNGVNRDSIARLNNIITALPHPADSGPADGRLTPAEVEAYASAWRAGTAWPLPPNPIPIGYLTRAAMLSLADTYGWDSTEPPPIWWTTVPPGTPHPSFDPARNFAKRTMMRYYVPGQPTEVSIKVNAGPGTVAWAIQEHVPAGWQAMAISDGGCLDPVHRIVKWGPFQQAKSAALTYQLLPPLNLAGLITVSGVGSFDGFDVGVLGRSELLPAPRLRWSSHPVSGTPILQVAGTAGGQFILETSEDLVNWVAIQEFKGSGDITELSIPVNPSRVRQFFRVRMMAD